MPPDKFSRPTPGIAKTHPDLPDVAVSPQKAFAREKILWLDQVRADTELTPLAFLAAYTLSNLVNQQKGCAWPSIALLAFECRVTKWRAQKVIQKLVERNHLHLEADAGRSQVLYAVIRHPVQPKNADQEKKPR